MIHHDSLAVVRVDIHLLHSDIEEDKKHSKQFKWVLNKLNLTYP